MKRFAIISLCVAAAVLCVSAGDCLYIISWIIPEQQDIHSGWLRHPSSIDSTTTTKNPRGDRSCKKCLHVCAPHSPPPAQCLNCAEARHTLFVLDDIP